MGDVLLLHGTGKTMRVFFSISNSYFLLKYQEARYAGFPSSHPRQGFL